MLQSDSREDQQKPVVIIVEKKPHIKAKVDVSFDDYWFFVKSNRRQESASPLHVESFYACKTYPVCRK